MVDLMTVTWARSGHQARGTEPLTFWQSQNIDDQLEFSRTWPDSPRGHFDKFSGASTDAVLRIIRQIADCRTTLFHAARTGAYQSHMHAIPALWNDTLDVVKHNLTHCGGWFGLLPLQLLPQRPSALVNRPAAANDMHITWPPTTDRSLLGVLTWFMQGVGNRAASMGTGNTWTANSSMLQFINGQKTTGGYEHVAKTYLGLIYENAASDLVHFYLTHLRGHGPTEAGSVHHLFAMVHSTGDSDRVSIRSDLNTAMDWTLKSFPGAWASRSPGHWSAEVVAHINTWIKGMGNHGEGLRWLRDMLQPHLDRWNNQNTIRTLVGGTRETQVTVGREVASSITDAITRMETIRTSIGLAFRQATTEGWSRALTDSISRVEGWQRTNRTGTSNTSGGSFGTTTAVTLGGETGGLLEFLVGKVSGEATETIQTQLHTQFTTHLEQENQRSGSTTTDQSTTTTTSLERMRERTHEMTREASTSLERTITQARSLTASLQQVTTVDGNRDQQIANVVQGLQEGKANVEATLR